MLLGCTGQLADGLSRRSRALGVETAAYDFIDT
jgi:hypothetical protein